MSSGGADGIRDDSGSERQASSANGERIDEQLSTARSSTATAESSLLLNRRVRGPYARWCERRARQGPAYSMIGPLPHQVDVTAAAEGEACRRVVDGPPQRSRGSGVCPGDVSLADLEVNLHHSGVENPATLRHALKDVPTGIFGRSENGSIRETKPRPPAPQKAGDGGTNTGSRSATDAMSDANRRARARERARERARARERDRDRDRPRIRVGLGSCTMDDP